MLDVLRRIRKMTPDRLMEAIRAGETRFEGLDMRGWDLNGWDLHNCRFANCDMRGAVFADANLRDVEFEECNARGVVMDDAEISSRTVMARCAVAGGSFMNLDFDGRNIRLVFHDCLDKAESLTGQTRRFRGRFDIDARRDALLNMVGEYESGRPGRPESDRVEPDGNGVFASLSSEELREGIERERQWVLKSHKREDEIAAMPPADREAARLRDVMAGLLGAEPGSLSDQEIRERVRAKGADWEESADTDNNRAVIAQLLAAGGDVGTADLRDARLDGVDMKDARLRDSAMSTPLHLAAVEKPPWDEEAVRRMAERAAEERAERRREQLASLSVSVPGGDALGFRVMESGAPENMIDRFGRVVLHEEDGGRIVYREGNGADHMEARRASLEQELERGRTDFTDYDFTGMDLTGLDMSGLDLRGAGFAGATATGVSFRGSNMSYADLRGVDAEGADFSRTRLQEADMSGMWAARTNLRGALLAGTAVADLMLNGADVRDAALVNVDFAAPGAPAALYDSYFGDALVRNCRVTPQQADSGAFAASHIEGGEVTAPAAAEREPEDEVAAGPGM